MIFRIFFGTVILLLITGLDTFAQDGRHSFSYSLITAPDILSFHVIDRVDVDYFVYKEDAMNGYGIGYAFNIIPFISAEVKYEIVEYRGFEYREEVQQENQINIDDKYFLVGIKLHPVREPFKIELNFDLLFSESSLSYLDRNLTTEGRGGEIGLAFGFQFFEINSIMFETSARLINTYGYDGKNISSGDVKSFYGYSTVFKLTYEIEF